VEKISSIVPRSRRVASADLAAAPAVRPGAPSYGRPIGESTIGTKDLMTTAQRAVAEQQRMLDERKQSAQLPKSVEEMTNRFFLQKALVEKTKVDIPAINIPAPAIAPPVSAEAASIAEDSQELADINGEIDVAFGADSADAQADEYVPVGTYLDVEV
jgi:hypothetical protein